MQPRLRIVHCFRSPVGGIFRHVRDLAEAQAAAGHAVGIVCDSSTGGEYEAVMMRDLEPVTALGIHRTPMQRHVGVGDLSAAVRTYSLISQLQPDVLHGHGAKGGVYSRLFGSLFRVSRSRVARIYSPHGGSLHYDPARPSGMAVFALERTLARLTDRLLFVSQDEYGRYETKVGRPRPPHALIYNGLRPAEFEPVTAAPDAANFLYIGMMRDLKGGDLFLDALERTASRAGRPVTAHMVGDGPDVARYRDIAGRLKDVTVAFHPPMPARRAFAMAQTVVVPSRAEALPYIVLEALAAGKPMIATRVGGIPEIFGAASPALVAPDAADIARLMSLDLADPASLAAAMPARDDIVERFSAAVMAAAVEASYREALRN